METEICLQRKGKGYVWRQPRMGGLVFADDPYHQVICHPCKGTGELPAITKEIEMPEEKEASLLQLVQQKADEVRKHNDEEMDRIQEVCKDLKQQAWAAVRRQFLAELENPTRIQWILKGKLLLKVGLANPMPRGTCDYVCDMFRAEGITVKSFDFYMGYGYAKAPIPNKEVSLAKLKRAGVIIEAYPCEDAQGGALMMKMALEWPT